MYRKQEESHHYIAIQVCKIHTKTCIHSTVLLGVTGWLEDVGDSSLVSPFTTREMEFHVVPIQFLNRCIPFSLLDEIFVGEVVSHIIFFIR